jgi:HEAT repeat protein
VLALAAALVALACGQTSRRLVRVDEDLHDPNPARRLAAVEAARQSGSRSHVPSLIELLDDDDAGVRLAAGQTLKDLTGRDTGYVAWASASDRRTQVEAWRAWWAAEGRGGRGAP